MYWSKLFIPTLKDTPQEAESASHQLMLRSGLIRMLMSGVYSYLPLGLMVLNNIKNIIRQEMNASGANELLLPALQPLELWLASGRDQAMGEVMIRFTDRKKRNICLGPTHEEVITDLVKNNVSSYRQLPLILYQIQTKFRDEIRPRFGLVRGCEFIMKDAYSFDKDEEGLNKNYQIMYDAYHRIFKHCGLDFLCIEAAPGVMGGNLSHEFMVPAEIGEDVVCSAPGMKKINAIEVGHIFKLGTKYIASLGANFEDQAGKSLPIIMGCYGIGVSRLISGIIEQNHDTEGIIWPEEIAPFQAIIMPLDVTDQKIMDKARGIYQALKDRGINPLLDDRDERAGVKFKDADLIGIPFQIIIGKEFLKNNNLELNARRSKEKISAPAEEIVKRIVDNG